MKKFLSRSFVSIFVFLFILSSCDTGYRTDIRQLLAAGALPYLKTSKLLQVSSYDSTGGNNDRITIPGGKSVTIFDADGPGMIVRMWFAIDSRDPYYLRRIVLRMFWDNEPEPSVEVPIGDFFGCGFKYKPYMSQYLGMTSGGFTCYFPMPFERNARIEITNETGEDITGFLYQVEYQKFEAALQSNVAYFHAQWNRNISTNYDSNYVILRTKGNGHLVGVNLNIQSYDGKMSFLEGDDMIYIDGEKRPSVRGTGTEDFFSGGWYFSHGEFAGQYNGLVYKNDTLGQIAGYRLFILDPVPFKKRIRVTVEHGHRNQDIADYSSTAYWYQMEPHEPFPALPIASRRIPLRIVKPARMYEAEKLKFRTEGLKSRVMDMSEFGPDWGGNRQMVIESLNKSTFSVNISGLKEPVYDMEIYYSRGPEYGNAEVVVNNMASSKIAGYDPNVKPDGKITLPGISALKGSVEIRFTVTGKDSLSGNYHVALDGINLIPKRVYIPEWNIIGPFPNPKRPGEARRGIDSAYLPEKLIDTGMVYQGAKQKHVRWMLHLTPENGCVSLADLVSPADTAVTYALTYIFSPGNRKTMLFFGTDDGCKVFFNGKELYRYLGERMAEPDQAEVELNLNPGWNNLMLKIENNFGAYAFYARITDPDNKLVISATKKLPPDIKK